MSNVHWIDFSSLAASPSGFLKLLFGFFASLVPQLKIQNESTQGALPLPDVIHIEETIQWQNHEHEGECEWVACSVEEVRDLSETVENKKYKFLIEEITLGEELS